MLDAGCGSGRYLVEAVERGATRVLGIDFAPEMIEIARRLAAATPTGGRIELRCMDLESLHLEERFDLVIANGLFDYLDRPKAVLAALGRCTRGVLVASFPERTAFRAMPRSLYWRLRGVRIHLFDVDSIAAVARSAGLDPFAIEKIGPIRLLIARS